MEEVDKITEQKSKRFVELDALRGLAVLIVVLYHYTTRYDELYGHPYLPLDISFGHLGVQLFFMISGFVILFSLEKTTSIIDFAIARISRLYPPYWAAVTITFIIVACFSLPGRETTLSQALANLTMCQRALSIPDVDGVYWSLAIELAFYAILAGLFIINQLKNIKIVSLLWLIAMLTVNLFELLPSSGFTLLIKMGLLLEHANLFIMGIMFYYLKKDVKDVAAHSVICFAVVTQGLVHSIESLYFVLGFTFLFYLFTYNKLVWLSKTPLVAFGHLSYSLYLIHQNIGYVIINYLYSLKTPFFLTICITFLCTISIAFLLFHVFERRFSIVLRNVMIRFKDSFMKRFMLKSILIQEGV